MAGRVSVLRELRQLLDLSPNATERISIRYGRTRPLAGNAVNIQS